MSLIVFLSSSISPWTSAETFLLRSPSATAPITRCISLLGRTRSSIRLLTDSMQPPQTWSVPLKETRWESLPSLPTTRLTRSSSVAERLVGADDLVEPVGDLAAHAGPVHRHASGEVAGLDVAQDAEQDLGVEALGLGGAAVLGGMSLGLGYAWRGRRPRVSASRPGRIHRPVQAGARHRYGGPVSIEGGTFTVPPGPRNAKLLRRLDERADVVSDGPLVQQRESGSALRVVVAKRDHDALMLRL